MVQDCGRGICLVLFGLLLGSLALVGCNADKTAPEDVTNLAASTGDQQVALAWQSSINTAGDLAGYKVYQDGAEIADLGADDTGFTVSGLTNGSPYAFKVAAYDGASNESLGAAVGAYANPALPEEGFSAESGMTNGGMVTSATQRLRGTVPNPTGSDTEYGGKAYLVINGNKIPLQVTQAPAAKACGVIYKEGLVYPLVDADWSSPGFDWLAMDTAPKSAAVQNIFEVTFSINAGPNTMKIEVYDLEGTLFASTNPWTVIGAIEPTSMVVTLWWDADRTDIDLHASPDDGTTHCYYRQHAAGEMLLDYDDTNGYGPEHITVDNATTSATYKIKVYYYADHNDSETTTPTTCSVNAQVNGETKLEVSASLSTASSSSDWTDGAHVWDAGEVEVNPANRLKVTLNTPELSSYPEVSLPVTILNPADGDAGVEGLTADNIFVVNAGTVMRPVTVRGGGDGAYTLTFTDITAGKRNLFVYVYAPITDSAAVKAGSDRGFMGGLSNSISYGTNYALLVGLNQYPPSETTVGGGAIIDAGTVTVDVTPKMPTSAGGAVELADFEAIWKDKTGGTNQPDTSVAPTGVAFVAGDTFRLTVPRPAVNKADYETVAVKYKKESWLDNSVNDMADLRAALLNLGVQTASNMWESANVTTLTDAAATRAAVLTMIENAAFIMEPYDMFLFGYSGHGAAGTNSSNQYLCTYEDGLWTSVDDMQGKLDLIPDGGVVNTFVIIDACFSGNFAKSGIEPGGMPKNAVRAVEKTRPFLPQAVQSTGVEKTFKGLTGGSLFVMTAVDGTHSSWDVGALQNGAFMYYVVEGMDIAGKRIPAAAANKNSDVWLTGEEVYNYAKPRATLYVNANIRNLPQFSDAEEIPQIHPDTNGRSRLLYNW